MPHIEIEAPVWIDVRVNQGCQRAIVFRLEPLAPCRIGQHALDHQRVHVDQAVLQQMQRQHGQLLVFQLVGRHLAALAIKDERVGAVPIRRR